MTEEALFVAWDKTLARHASRH
ncbi:hypothetical protein CBM2608_A130010 [Cupriavidus taiwanensis]|nr:hypothetical protein CBM2608_A130010 [Cupriavidus taiwanensis]